MATWVRLGTGTAPSNTDASLVGDYALDNGTIPSDWDGTAVNSVRVQWSIVGTSFNDDDSWNDDSVALETGVIEISTHAGGGSTGNTNTTVNNDNTDSSISGALSDAQWIAALLRGNGTDTSDEWADYVKVKGPDGGNLAAASVTVTIDYTPDSGVNVDGDGIGHATPSGLAVSDVVVNSTQRGHGVSSAQAVADVIVIGTSTGHAIPSGTAAVTLVESSPILIHFATII